MPGQILLIGTDRMWKAHNAKGERFGKQRLRKVLTGHAYRLAKQIVEEVIGAVEAFCGARFGKDGIPLVVIRSPPTVCGKPVKTSIRILEGVAQDLSALPSRSVDLVVTSPPYPMIQMWDGVFAEQDERIWTDLEAGKGHNAFERMHRILDGAWRECDRVLKPGAIACVNIGDAVRTLNGDFRLYSNHSRILKTFLENGYAVLPDILWRKQTNAPNKFLGSGMLPVGAYVTYEHEYILVLRKGPRRAFDGDRAKKLRRESAFFWEERNVWFSDVWQDIKGTPQALVDGTARQRSAAFPFELAYRLICMFSIKKDLVLDPFVGTGTTLGAALAAGRSAVGVERDATLAAVAWAMLAASPGHANAYTRDRLVRHLRFVAERTAQKGPLRHVNAHYGFAVMTSQERELLIADVLRTHREDDETLRVEHDDRPQEDLVAVGQEHGTPAAPGEGSGGREPVPGFHRSGGLRPAHDRRVPEADHSLQVRRNPNEH